MRLSPKTLRYLAGVAAAALAAAAGMYAFRAVSVPKRTVFRTVYTQNPPYYSSKPGQPPHGVTVDLFNEAAARQGIKLEWVYSMEDPETQLRMHLVDLYPMGVMTPERQASAQLHLSSAWLRTESWLVWPTRLGNDAPDLTGRKLGVPTVLAYRRMGQEKFPTSILDPKSDRPAVMSALCNGETSAALMESRSLATYLLDRPPACEGVAMRTKPIPGAFIGLAVFGRSEDARAIDRLRDSLGDMAHDGTINRLYRNWGFDFSPETQLVDELNRTLERRIQLTIAVVVLSCLLAALGFIVLMLRRALVKADHATEAKSRFLANMSHEIRTPLNGIVGLAEMLRTSGRMEPEQMELVGSIQLCGRNLAQVLNDVLDMSKFEAGKMVLEEVDFDSREPVRVAMAALRPEAERKNLKFKVEMQPDMPRYFKGDCTRAAQALLNLVSNAVKFTAQGTILIHVSLESRDADCLLIRFEVRDNGIGIDPEMQKTLFQPFTQADASTTRKFGGTGLGLTIVKHLAERMGGTVGLESELGRGSKIWFTISVKEGKTPVVATAPTAGHSKLRVLIAEDNPLNQKVAQALLKRLGHQTEVAANGRVALEKYFASEFDAILMDCQMPELDGFEATREIRRHEQQTGRRIRIIAATANTLSGDRERCIEAGMDDYIPKPFAMKDIQDRLQGLTGAPHLQENLAPAGSA